MNRSSPHSSHNTEALGCFGGDGMRYERAWEAFDASNPACRPQLQVFTDGRVTLIHSPSVDESLQADSGNVFRVRWADGRYPMSGATCADTLGCIQGGNAFSADSCVCEASVESRAVFTNLSSLPSPMAVESELSIGAVPPDSFASGVYAECSSSECVAAKAGGVTIFLHAESGGTLDERSILRVNLNATRPAYLANKASTVHVGGDEYEFRNPPKFHSFTRPATRDAEHETDALIDHLFWHKNVAPFLARRLIQRFTSSNPSPRYVRAVASAFRTGRAGLRTDTNEYGDLAATFGALLLDREARSLTLDAEPTHGMLREPLLKVYNVLRSFSFGTDMLHMLHADLYEDMGQQHFMSPTVFNFYAPDYQPDGPIAETRLVSPEAQLGTGPYVVGFLNQMSTLVRSGAWKGELRYSALDAEDVDATIEDLNLMMATGRLNSNSKLIIKAAYERELAAHGATAALQAAQELMLFTSEFHATNIVQQRDVSRTPLLETPSQSRPYRAVVYLYLNGGADTFNLLVPTGGCENNPATIDLYAQYQELRGGNALDKDAKLLAIESSDGSQPCTQWGIHHQMTTLRDLYLDGEASFVANVGALVQPITKADYNNGAARPPSLFAHNTQTLTAQNVHAQASSSAKGVLGRTLAELEKTSPSGAPPHRLRSYSVAGNTKILEGSVQPPTIVSTQGPVRLARYAALQSQVSGLTSAESESVFAETYTNILEKAVEGAEELDRYVSSDEAELTASFPTDHVGLQFKQAARIIASRPLIDSERDAFFVEYRGEHHHKWPLM